MEKVIKVLLCKEGGVWVAVGLEHFVATQPSVGGAIADVLEDLGVMFNQYVEWMTGE